MTRQLKPNERLVYAGEAPLRASNGTPLPPVPQHMIVAADEADPNLIVELKENERLVMAGMIFNDMELARKRFAAKKAGQEMPPPEEGTPLYFKMDASEINPKNGLTYVQEKSFKELGEYLAPILARDMRKKKALEQQGIKEDMDNEKD